MIGLVNLPEDIFYYMTKSGLLSKTDIEKLGSTSKFFHTLKLQLISILEQQVENFQIKLLIKNTTNVKDVKDLVVSYMSLDTHFDINWNQLLPVEGWDDNVFGNILIEGRRNKITHSPYGYLKIKILHII